VLDSASKHALEAFFESLRSEVVHSGIQVTLFCPGYINTQLSVNALTGDGTSYGGSLISIYVLLIDLLCTMLC
jgi:NAD(P)-dependent dehydrogenase (short-subunit alcohol dehydrogenase family)